MNWCFYLSSFLSECSLDLTALEGVKILSINSLAPRIIPNIDIISPGVWCQNDIREFLRVDFGSLRLVGGIVISGNSNADSWITKFSVKFGLDAKHFQVFNGVSFLILYFYLKL